MLSRYKLIISNNNLYKEIDLSPECIDVRIGTSPECDVRLHKELFFAPIELTVHRDETGWNIICSDNLCCTVGDIRKLLTKRLIHGDKMAVKYQESDIEVFRLSFVIDFDYEKKEYDLVIDLQGKSHIKIGGTTDSNIYVKDNYLGTDCLTLSYTNGKIVVKDNNTKYGVFVNGMRINKLKEIEDCNFISIVGYSFYYKNNKLYTSTRESMTFNGLNYNRVENHKSHFTYPKFNRNSRIQYVIPTEDLEIQYAAQKPQKPKRNIVMSLIPSFIMLAMTIVLRGVIGGGGTFVIYSAISMSLGIGTSIVSFIQDNKTYKKEYKERIEAYDDYIVKKKEVIEHARGNELRVRDLIYRSLEKSLSEVDSFGKLLFEKSQGDMDFLQVYLGRGRVESVNPVKYTKQEFVDLEDPLAPIPETVSESYKYIENAPIISDFNASCGIGVVGNPTNLENILKNITLDIAIRHFYNDVKMVFVLSDGYLPKMNWIRWLRNVDNEKLDAKNIVCDEESKNMILENLYLILSTRENMLNQNRDTVFDEQYVVFITDAMMISSHPVSKYFKNCVTYGFTFVFLEEYEENIPQGSTEVIRLDGLDSGKALKTENGDIILDFEYPLISDETAESVAFKLGAVKVDEVSLEGELTKRITMFELLGILSVEDINLSERWSSSMVYESLAAPLGVKRKEQVVYLDISDKPDAHGPHGLVAGTTGSGKSEVLQTYILSMATLFHPYEVGFVIIDFKGGGMANQFKSLPHLIGTITNIDGHEINRSLLSIKAELVKRQEIFSENGVNHINDYIKLYKAKKVNMPLPHLIMIVDEFAELKAEYPDFMKELISAARIGRTLGVHLILATQKPAGVVDSQIWSNSKFKMCLKVQTKEDSNEVLKTPLAAEIVEPGRAYFQVGNNEIFELFQSAYSGAAVPEGNDANGKIYAIYEKNLWGKKTLKYTNKKIKNHNNSLTQLQSILDYVHDYCLGLGIKRLPGICLPSLKEVIRTGELNYNYYSANISVPIGMYDDPEQQRQGEVSIDVSRDNVYIIGSAQMGKTVMLQTIVYGLIKKYTPEQVNLYLIDCGSMVLKIFEDSNHVGGVVLSNEDEKCKNLYKLLNTAVIQRKKILSSKGVGNYTAYLDAGYKDMPMIVVAIDNMAAFKEYFPDRYEEINSLSREAQGVGISFVVTAATSNALSYRTQANFGKKFVLNCNETNEYSSVFGHCKQTPKENTGRGLLMLDKKILEYQVAIFGQSEKEAERSKELKQYIEERNSEFTTKVIKIPMIPDKLSISECMSSNPQVFRNKGILPIGMDYALVDLTSIDLNNVGSVALMGDVESRDALVGNLVRMIAQTIIFHNIEAFVIDDKSKKLKKCAEFGYVKHYTSDVAEGMGLVSDFCDYIARRRDEEDKVQDSYIMLLINNADVFKRICADKSESKALSEAIKAANEANAFILLNTVENQQIGFNSSEVLKTIKEERQAILFAPLAESKMFDISGRNKLEAAFDATMGYRFDGGTCSKIKIFD